MSIRKLYCLLAASICFLLITSCKEKKEPSSESSQQFQNSYNDISNSNKRDSIKAIEFVHLLDSIQMPSVKNAPTIDSLFEYLFNQWVANPESFANIPEEFSKATNNNKLSEHSKKAAVLYLSLSFYIQYKIEQMDSIILQISKHENELDDANKILYYRNLGLQLTLKNRTGEAVSTFQKALDLVKTNPNYNSCELGNIYCNYATVYLKMNDNTKALELLKKSYSLLANNNCNANDLQTTILNTGVAYVNLHLIDSAICYYKKQLPLLTNNSFRNYTMSYVAYLNIGGAYIEEKKYDSARYYFAKAALINDKVKDENLSILLNTFSAIANAPIKDVSKEVSQIKNYVALFYKNNDLYDVQNVYEALNKIAVIKNQYKDALYYLEKLDSIKELATSAENKKMVGELELKYHTAEKDLEITKQQSQIKQSRNLTFFLIACIIILILIAILSIKTIKDRKEREAETMREHFTHQLLEGTEHERERIAGELHDNINQRLVMLKKDNFISNPLMAGRIEDLINSIRNIARNLYPVSLPHIGLQYSIEHLCEEMTTNSAMLITSEISFNETILNKSTELHLFRIVQEALNNTIKHANATEAKVTIKDYTQQHLLMINIKDNGRGFEVDTSLKSKDSFGLLSILQRCKAIKGICNIHAGNNGTIISINVPYSSHQILENINQQYV